MCWNLDQNDLELLDNSQRKIHDIYNIPTAIFICIGSEDDCSLKMQLRNHD